MKTIKDIEYLEDVKVLMRVDFNVPIQNNVIKDDNRIKMTLPTLYFLRDKGARTLLLSHLENIDGQNDSLKIVVEHIQNLGLPISFLSRIEEANDWFENKSKSGDIAVLENIRFLKGEKENDPAFSKELASLCDIYINEAFSVSHREHASIVGIPKYCLGYAGLQFESEIKNLSKAFEPKRPFLFLLGGAKFETKMRLVNKFRVIADDVYIGGALANDLLKAKGYEVGESRISNSDLDVKDLLEDKKISIPIDLIDSKNSVYDIDSLPEDEIISDIGPESLESIKSKINRSNLIVWNGPFGLYEKGFKKSTLEIAKAIGERTLTNKDNIVSILGGGDTLASINELGNEKDFTFVSTAGGAMLDYLANGELVGERSLIESQRIFA